MSRIVIVGGGAAGIELATLLGKKFKHTKQHQVILVEPESRHYWKPRFHELAAGSFDTELDTICYFTHGAHHGYQHYQARMTDIKRDTKQLVVSKACGETDLISYDYLIIAIGAVSNDFGTQGVWQNCLFLDTPVQALASWQQISTLLRSGKDATINIVGAGATGVELAAELVKVSGKLNRKFNAAKLQVNLIEATDRVMPNGPEAMSQKIHRKLAALGVNIHLKTRIAKVEQQGMETASGDWLGADLQFWVAGIKAPEWLKNISGLASNKINQLEVESTLQTTLDKHIFALGDCAAIPQPNGTWVPPKAQAANRAALYLAKTLVDYLNNKPLSPFIYKDAGMFVALGDNFAVGTTMNNRLIIQGSIIRRLYDTIFRLHQKTVTNLFTVSRLMISKRLKCIFKPGNL